MYRDERVAAFIPARGGSKGIPGKNLHPFLGRPLVFHSIDAAKLADAVDRVVVSTDGEDIASVARTAGAEIVQRPAELAGDHATTESAIEHYFEQCDPGEAPDIVVLLQPTSPLRPEGSIDEAVRTLVDGGFDSLLSVCPSHRFFWSIDESGAKPRYDIDKRPRRQDLTPEQVPYVENGSIYVFTRTLFETTGNRLGGKIGHVIHSERFQGEIDTMDDLVSLEAIARRPQT